MRSFILIGIVSLVCISSVVHASEREVDLIAEYFDLVASGNYESANYLWAPQCQERAHKFGITYENIPIKIDCSSPIIRELDIMRDYLQPPIKNVNRMPGRFSQLRYSAVVGGKNVEYMYWAQQIGGYYWLTYPQDFYAQGWITKQTKYFNIIYNENLESFLNPIVLNEADKFVETAAIKLGLSDEALTLLEEQKIMYYYCDDDKTVKDITGHLVKGMYDMASDDIISAFFPHYHELTHFLINYKLRTLPLYTLPLFREGVAVYLGGRWSKAPEPLESLAAYLYKMDIVELDSILTMHGFEQNAESDIAYPVAALFVKYLVDKKGMDNFLDLYRSFSGSINSLYRLNIDSVQQRLTAYLDDDDWTSVIADFEKEIEVITTRQASILPGKLNDGKLLLEHDAIKIYENDDWLGVEFSSPTDSTYSGNLIFTFEDELPEFRSGMFEDQYKDTREFEGYRFGIRFDANEAGVYDYATSHLLAKYIWGITPSNEYLDKEEKKLYFKFKKDVTGGLIPHDGDCKLLMN